MKFNTLKLIKKIIEKDSSSKWDLVSKVSFASVINLQEKRLPDLLDSLLTLFNDFQSDSNMDIKEKAKALMKTIHANF